MKRLTPHSKTLIGSVAWMQALLCSALLLVVFPYETQAQDAATLSEERELIERDSDNNLDSLFSYAKRATNERDAKQAEWALRKMLKKNPNLGRVKLELAVSLLQQGKYHESKALLEEVYESNPPEAVKANINKVLEVVNAGLKPHRFNGGFSFGVNDDSNANASPSSGGITILDTSLRLGAGSGRESDMQSFFSVNLAHSYRSDIEEDVLAMHWKTELLEYRTKQATLDNLDLTLHSIRTGPEFSWLDEGVKLGLFAGYNIYELNHYTYMRNPKGEYALDVQLTNDLVLQFKGLYEYRGFQNAPNVSTYELRQGQAWQQGVGLRYVLASDWLATFETYARNEDATADYYENRQYAVNAGITHLLSKDLFVSMRGGYRAINYQSADPLISTRVRDDEEYTFGTNLVRNFTIPETGDRFTLSTGYQYRDAHSNIQNYAYDNHRFSFALGVSF